MLVFALFENFFSSRPFYKSLMIKICNTDLPDVLYGCETEPLTLINVIENYVLWKMLENKEKRVSEQFKILSSLLIWLTYCG
jgi:hypothetical protein